MTRAGKNRGKYGTRTNKVGRKTRSERENERKHRPQGKVMTRVKRYRRENTAMGKRL